MSDDADDDEESMDWWTKYFASVDAMIEVGTILKWDSGEYTIDFSKST